MASKLKLWNKVGRFATGVIIACFFLPFFGVSCGGIDVITISGADMVGGCKPGGAIADMADQQEGMPSSGGKLDAKIDKVDREPLAMAAMALAVIVFGLSWVRTRKALLAACVCSVIGIGALVGLQLRVGGKLNDAVAESSKHKDKLTEKDKVEAGGRLGLWLVYVGFLGTAIVTGLALREEDAPTATG